MSSTLRKLLCFTIFALLLAGCASRGASRAPRAPGDAKGTSRGDVNYDKFTGSCEAWQSYVARKGVQDCNGRLHPGWIGATRCAVSSTGYNFTPKRESGILGRTCFSVKLPRNANQFQVASACVRIVDWVPPSAIPASCTANRTGWLDQVLRHEQYHLNQCDSEVWKANQRWVSETHKFSACGFTESGALDELTEKISDTLTRETRRIMDNIDRESDRFHAGADGQPLNTNCGACR
ncbi:MAG: hypothetical protein ABIP64_08545 [Burkholderiales bacterium]